MGRSLREPGYRASNPDFEIRRAGSRLSSLGLQAEKALGRDGLLRHGICIKANRGLGCSAYREPTEGPPTDIPPGTAQGELLGTLQDGSCACARSVAVSGDSQNDRLWNG